MAYRDPEFYFSNLSREIATPFGGAFTTSSAPGENPRRLYDGIAGFGVRDLFTFPTDLDASDKEFILTPQSPALEAEWALHDTVIIAGHNAAGNDVNVIDGAATDLLNPDHTLTAGVNVIPLTAAYVSGATTVKIIKGLGSGATVVSLSEVVVTRKRTLSRGPNPSWSHGWANSFTRHESPAGVSVKFPRSVASPSAPLGQSQKTFKLTWEHISGADRQVFLDGRLQTSDWAHPFWFLPPDDEFDILQVEMSSDPVWRHHQTDNAGQTDTVSIELIEVLPK